MWSFPLPSARSFNSPSVHEERVYFQSGPVFGETSGRLFALDAVTGDQLWDAPFGSQSQSYEAPAVGDGGVYIAGGYYGGVYRFDFEGAEQSFARFLGYDKFTPTLAGGRLFSWAQGIFMEHHPDDLAELWRWDFKRSTNVHGVNTTAAVSGDSAAIMEPLEVVCMDLTTRTVRWRVAGTFAGTPAIGDGRVFGIQGNAVRSFGLADGAAGVTYLTDSGPLVDQPIIFNDRLVISSEAWTWMFELASGRLLQTLEAGGRLSYSEGYLLAAGGDGVLRAFLAVPQGRMVVKGPEGAPLEAAGEALQMGAPPVGGTSRLLLTVGNSGQGDLEDISLRLEGPHAGEFSLDEPPAAVLAAGGEFVVEITHAPWVKGRRESVLVISSNDALRPEFRIALVAVPPDVTTLAAVDVTGAGAVLMGQVAANGNAVEIVFEYGLTDALGTTVAAMPAALSGDDEGEVRAVIAGLPPGTSHYFRVGAGHGAERHWSETRTFTTLSDNARLTGITNRLFNRYPEFHPEVFAYIATVDFDQSTLEMRPVTEHPGAALTINGIPVPRGSYSPPLPLAVGSNLLTVVVTAEDGVTTLSYTTVVTRLPEFLDLSGGAAAISADGFSARMLSPQLRLDHHPGTGSSLMVVENTGLAPIFDEFRNLQQGQRVTLHHDGVDYAYVANYYGGSGNDLVLHWADTFAAAWGMNGQGQLGDGSAVDRAAPVAVELAEGVLAGKTLLSVSAGYLHSLALLHDGTMAAWGYNVQGQLGVGSFINSKVPQQVLADGALAGKTVVAITAGAYHNLALCSDGTLVAWGQNAHGQLGTGDRATRNSPVVVEARGALAGRRVMAIAAGMYQSFALCSDGSVAAWGYNDEGELGDGSTATALLPVRVNAEGALAGRTVTRIAAGQYHALALTADGGLVSWGFNGKGQLGDGTTTDRDQPVGVVLEGGLSGKMIVEMVGGGSHSLVRFDDGSAAGWGDDSRGQLTGEAGVLREFPKALQGEFADVFAGAMHSGALVDVEALRAWGDARAAVGMSGPAVFGEESRWVTAASGPAAFHSLVIGAVPSQAGVPVGGLAMWRVGHFGEAGNAGLGADCEDCDEDGVPNLVEYAFGMDPWVPDAGRLPRPEFLGDRLELRVARAAGAAGVRIGAEWSESLEEGSWREVPDTGAEEEAVFRIPVDGVRLKFLRIRVSMLE